MVIHVDSKISIPLQNLSQHTLPSPASLLEKASYDHDAQCCNFSTSKSTTLPSYLIQFPWPCRSWWPRMKPRG